ncbi:hypothetical protein SAMN05428962_2746 [Paenibacillus sp. BC26]|nr:hypothetical protein SAMN05428962_2746 [Paenibacillus sp. BC26]
MDDLKQMIEQLKIQLNNISGNVSNNGDNEVRALREVSGRLEEINKSLNSITVLLVCILLLGTVVSGIHLYFFIKRYFKELKK